MICERTAWNKSLLGILGDRTGGSKARPFPMNYNGTFYGKQAMRVCAGNVYALVLSTDGNLFTFGDNTYGQLGLPATTTRAFSPLRIPLTGDLQGEQIIDIACGYEHALALCESGKVVAWGRNNVYQLGDGTTNNRFVPAKVNFPTVCNASSITAGWYTNFAICKYQSQIYVWGSNSNGEAGVGSQSAITSPTQLTTQYRGTVVEISSSQYHSFMLTSDGRCYGTGLDNQGNTLFQGTTTASFSVVDNNLNYTIPWQMRKLPLFEAAGRVYALLADSLPPTRPNNGFNMYYMNTNETEKDWQAIEYDPVSNHGFAASLYSSHFLKNDEYVYFFGGFVNDTVSDKIFRASYADVEHWEILVDRLPYTVAGGMAQIIGDYFYIFGGIVSMYDPVSGAYTPQVTNTTIRAPLSNITNWSVWGYRYIPSPLHSSSVALVNGYLYIFGGCHQVFNCSQNIYRAPVNDIGTWHYTYGILPHFYANSVIVQTFQHLFLFGGFSDSAVPGGVFISRALLSDPIGSWMALTDVLPSFMASSARFNGTEIVLVGYDFRNQTGYDVSSTSLNQIIEIQLVN